MKYDQKQQPWIENINICRNPSHNPPSHMVYPAGEIYHHTCPGCGKIQNVIGPEFQYKAKANFKSFRPRGIDPNATGIATEIEKLNHDEIEFFINGGTKNINGVVVTVDNLQIVRMVG